MKDKIKKGDKLTIEGLNISPDGKMYFNKQKKRRRNPMPVLTVVYVTDDTIEIPISI